MNSPHADGHSPVGFPHSEISGSRPVSGSPELIAAVHVLHRLWLPRHPPYALRSLTLSLRHASSSRAGFDSRRVSSRTRFASFAWKPRMCASSGRYDLQRRQTSTSSSAIRFSTSSGTECRVDECSRRPKSCGGAERDRTDDLRLAKPALSQLSYSPVAGGAGAPARPTKSSGPGQS